MRGSLSEEKDLPSDGAEALGVGPLPRGGDLKREIQISLPEEKDPPSDGAEALGVGPLSRGGDLKREVKISVLLDMFEHKNLYLLNK